jgi:hypothetical protein
LLPSIKWGSEVDSRTENVAHGYQGEGPHNELLRQEAAALSVSHQPRQLGDVGGDAPRLVAGEQLGRCASPRLLLEVDVGERLPIGVADDKAGSTTGVGRPIHHYHAESMVGVNSNIQDEIAGRPSGKRAKFRHRFCGDRDTAFDLDPVFHRGSRRETFAHHPGS